MQFSTVVLIGLLNWMRIQADDCDYRYCYVVARQVRMNNIQEIRDICRSMGPTSQLLSIYDYAIQSSVEKFFVNNLATFGESNYVVLALQRNTNREWIWINTNKPASQPFINWKDGNPIDDPETDCAFFTPHESSKWWNSLCSSKNVTVICMTAAQDLQTFRTFYTQSSTRYSSTTFSILTQPSSLSTRKSDPLTRITTPIATTTTTSTTTTTTTTTLPTTTTSPTTTSTTMKTSTSTTTIATTSKRLSQPSTATTISSSTTSGPPVHPGSDTGKNNPTSANPSYLSEGEKFKENLLIGFGVSLSLVFLICLITVFLTRFIRKKNSKKTNSKFSSVTDIDHKKHYQAQSVSPVNNNVNNHLENAEDRRSSDSGFDNEDAKHLERVESTDLHSEPNDDVENPESSGSLYSGSPTHSVSHVDFSTESGPDASARTEFDWEYPSNTGKKSLKKVSFDLEHVVEIPN